MTKNWIIAVLTILVVVAFFDSEEEAGEEFQSAKIPNAIDEKEQVSLKRTSLPPGAVRVRPANVMDNNGFGKPMIAATVMVPPGWQSKGGVNWQLNNSGCGKNAPHVNWTAQDANGVGMVSILPDETWTGSSLPMPNKNCPNVRSTNVKELVLSYVSRYRPQASVVEYQERRDVVDEISKNLVPNRRDQFGTETRQWAGAGQALVSYSVNGAQVDEVVAAGMAFTLMKMPGVMPGEIREFLTVSVYPGFAMRMPKGKLNLKQAEMIRKSGKPNPAWIAKMTEHRAKMAGINARGAAARAKIRAKTNQEIMQIQNDTWRNTQASNDRMHRETVEGIRGVETYNDPYNGGTVQLDNTYNNAWQLENGDYVLTDDESFNPYAATGISGQKLEAVP